MRDKVIAEKEMPGLNVIEQDMGNNKLFSRCCLFSAGFHPNQDA